MAINPALVFALPLAYIMGSTVILMQLSILLSLLGQLGVKVRSMKQLAPIEPGERFSGSIQKPSAGGQEVV